MNYTGRGNAFTRTKLCTSLVIAFGGLVMAPGVAVAQDSATLQRVEITGSNIKRTDAETASPVHTITRDDIQKSGKTTIADVLLGLNGNSNGSVPLSFGVGFAAGASGVSLRGLGANSTLILLNGRRMAPYGLADDGQRTFVDLSTIPLDAVERVDIVKDGASAIYGSDAIAGVVNIITRQDYKGVVLNASYGQSRYGDDRAPKVSITGGTGDLAKDKYNIFFTLEAQKIGEIRQSDRAGRGGIGDPDIMARGYDLGTGTGYGGYKVSGTSVSSSPVGWARPYTAQNGSTAVAGSVYTQLAQPAGGCTTAPAVAALGYSGCTYNALDFQQLQPPEDKVNFLTRGTLQISPNLTAFGEVGVFKSKVSTTYTPSGVSGAWADPVGGQVISNTAITMGPNHPDNPFNAASGANGGLGYNARLRYLTADLGGRNNTYDTTVNRLLGGLKGTVADWDWETGLLYTESKTDQTTDGYIRNSVLRDYLNGTNLSGMNPTNTYYRLGANAGLNSAAVNAAIAPHITNASKTSITSIDGKASRELMQLSGGAMSLAVGGELRKEKVDNPPKPYTYEADIIGLGYSGFSGSRNITAIYAELNAPVLKNLELSAALRSDHYSDYGTSTTPKVGFKFTPTPQIVLRGTYAEGFRAPGAAESGQSVGGAAGYTNVIDPVRCPGGVLAAGANPGDCNAQVLAISTANPFVKPEQSKSYTFGLVLEPIKDTSISIDLWQIKRTNEILGADPATVLGNPAGFPAAVTTRDPSNPLVGIPNSGSLISIQAPYTNGPNTVTNGIDLDLRHKFNLGESGKLTTALTWTHLNTYKRTLEDGSTYEYAGTDGPTALSSSSGMPKDKATLAVTWDRGPLSLTGTANYVSGIKNVEFQGDPNGCLITFSDGSNAPSADCTTPSFTTFDLTGKYQVEKNLQIYGAITNLFDRVAPYDLSAFYGITHYNANYHQAGGVGRTYNIGVRYQFN